MQPEFEIMVMLEINKQVCPYVFLFRFMIKKCKTIHLTNCNFTYLKHAVSSKMSISSYKRRILMTTAAVTYVFLDLYLGIIQGFNGRE